MTAAKYSTTFRIPPLSLTPCVSLAALLICQKSCTTCSRTTFIAIAAAIISTAFKPYIEPSALPIANTNTDKNSIDPKIFLFILLPFIVAISSIADITTIRTIDMAIALANARNGFCFDTNANIEPMANIATIIRARVENTVFFMSFI